MSTRRQIVGPPQGKDGLSDATSARARSERARKASPTARQPQRGVRAPLSERWRARHVAFEALVRFPHSPRLFGAAIDEHRDWLRTRARCLIPTVVTSTRGATKAGLGYDDARDLLLAKARFGRAWSVAKAAAGSPSGRTRMRSSALTRFPRQGGVARSGSKCAAKRESRCRSLPQTRRACRTGIPSGTADQTSAV